MAKRISKKEQELLEKAYISYGGRDKYEAAIKREEEYKMMAERRTEEMLTKAKEGLSGKVEEPLDFRLSKTISNKALTPYKGLESVEEQLNKEIKRLTSELSRSEARVIELEKVSAAFDKYKADEQLRVSSQENLNKLDFGMRKAALKHDANEVNLDQAVELGKKLQEREIMLTRKEKELERRISKFNKDLVFHNYDPANDGLFMGSLVSDEDLQNVKEHKFIKYEEPSQVDPSVMITRVKLVEDEIKGLNVESIEKTGINNMVHENISEGTNALRIGYNKENLESLLITVNSKMKGELVLSKKSLTTSYELEIGDYIVSNDGNYGFIKRDESMVYPLNFVLKLDGKEYKAVSLTNSKFNKYLGLDNLNRYGVYFINGLGIYTVNITKTGTTLAYQSGTGRADVENYKYKVAKVGQKLIQVHKLVEIIEKEDLLGEKIKKEEV